MPTPVHKFYAGHIVLRPGDRLVLYTDRVTEAMDKHDELFSEGRLRKTFHGAKDLSGKEIIERIVKDVQRFSTGAPQSDDIPLLLLS